MNFQPNFVLRRTATILSVATITLAFIAAISGILIGFNYEPTAGNAYRSLAKIINEIPNGGFIYSLHNLAGNGIIVVALIQLVVMFLGRQFRSSWLTAWISGILLTLSTIGLGWTAMILGWNQLGYWRLKVELGTIASIPLIGETVANVLTGGGGINTTTIIRFYTIHSYVLSLAAIAFAIIHLVALIIQEQESKLSVRQLEKLIATIKLEKQTTAAENAPSNI
ncbi:cytochrome bc complex cytochrome b subunit [Pleurocapsales cyanobacterium LEGE 10410]|nr:cytochrome bc complex cytochrome b subunit [Pleurocapsales cyanobacterium LEGE 10410]